MQDVIIIGAGLSGLTTAHALSKKGISCLILESRNRPGGRINTLEGPLEMGATWLGSQHTHLMALLSELGIELFEQFTDGKISYDLGQNQAIQYFEMPPGQAPSYRIKGGTSTIINCLLDGLSKAEIKYDSVVKSIVDADEEVVVSLANGKTCRAKHVIVTVPPQLAHANIDFEPPLPSKKQIAMAQTHTWMGDSIKYGVTYSQPFWKTQGLSGMGFSQAGVIQEAHDHCNFEEDYFALKGFLNPNLRAFKPDDRRKIVINSLVKLFGEEARDYQRYDEAVWQDDQHTSLSQASAVVPHQNNGHDLLRAQAFGGKVIFSGTESSPIYGGYMDGAVYSGMSSAQLILAIYERSASS